jgi:GNAT superfamily N-acetyltransferase
VTTVADGEPDLVCRRARPADREAVVAFTEDTWADRGTGDYVPRRYDAWMDADDGETAVTVLFDASEEGTAPTDEVAAIVRAVMLSEWEGWLHGLRVNPDYRRHGLGTRLTRVGFDWVRERGGRVARSWIHSWNAPSLGLSRTAGFDPAVEYRMVYPDPDADATPDADLNDPTGPGDADVPRPPVYAADDPHAVGDPDPDAAWAYWTDSAVRTATAGLVLDDEETWAVSTLTRRRLRDVAADGRLLVVGGTGTEAAAGGRAAALGRPDGPSAVRGLSYRNRTFEYAPEDESATRYAEYAIGAWADVAAADALLAAVARDAARVGADETRVLIPESIQRVSDAALAGAGVAEEPSFIMAADLTDPKTVGEETVVE